MKSLVCLLVFSLTLQTVHAADWTALHRDQTNRNSTAEQPTLPLTEVGSFPNSYFTPLVSGNIIVTAELAGTTKKIVAYQLTDQRKLWEYSTGVQTPLQPIIERGTLFFGVAGQSTIYAISLLTGLRRWQATLPTELFGPRFAPVVIGSNLFVAGTKLHEFDLSGNFRWSMNYDIVSPMATDGSHLIARLHSLKTVSIDPQSGQQQWAFITNSTTGTEPVISGQTIYVGGYQKLFALNLATGQQRWSYNTEINGPIIGSLAVAGSLIFVGTSAGTITALNDNGLVIWTHQLNSSNNSGNGWQPPFLLAGDRVIAQADSTTYAILNAQDGSEIFRGLLPLSGATVQAVAEQRLWLQQNSVTHLYDASSWQAGTLGDPPTQKGINPVIIIPGILESWPVLGQWQLDPVTHNFDNLLTAFHAAGYIDNQNLFSFPYDWHNSNTVTALALAQKIAAVKTQTGATQVDLVAHSMGNLAVRSYVESSDYANDVDQYVAIAAPNAGSVKDYLTWEAGETGPSSLDTIKEKLLQYEALKRGYGNDVVGYVHDRVAAINELLPTFDYLRDSHNQPLPYLPCLPSLYPCNPYLEDLNNHLDNLLQRTTTLNLIGNISTQATLEELTVDIPTDNPAIWQHGRPLNYPNAQGLNYGAGDHTVLVSSAHLDGVEERRYNSDHSAILTDAATDVVKWLSDKTVTITPRVSPLRYVFVRLFSPIHLLLTDATGRHLGTDPQTGNLINEIPNAYYSGPTNGEEYALIPDPPSAAYGLQLTGTASGDFSVTASLIDDQSQTTEVTQAGTTALTVTSNYTLTVEPSSVRIDPALIANSSPSPSPTPCVSALEKSLVIRAP